MVRELRKNRTRFALDNFTYAARWEPYLDLVDYVKVNVQGVEPGTVADQVHLLNCRGVKLLEHCVESQEEYATYRDMGFDMFQGYFFCRPEIIRGRKMPASRISTMRLLSQLQSPDSSLEELERSISQDVALCYRLLRYLNSVQFGLVRKIESIRHAISCLGLDHLRVWASIILLAKIDEKPVEFMETALIRGEMCELLGVQGGHADAQPLFMAGLFSTIEAFLDAPIDNILKELPISLILEKALLSLEGDGGEALRCTLSYERGNWAFVDLSPFSDEAVTQTYLKAISWADETIGEMVS